MLYWVYKITKEEIKMAVFGLVFVTVGIWGTYAIIKFFED
ncbi:hypothetical protein [Enterococcus phage EFap02]|nr:hypothetical protein [Enterococcus phage EFap02]